MVRYMYMILLDLHSRVKKYALFKKDFDYTIYDMQCHMAVYVIAVTFLVTLSMTKFTNIVIPTYSQFIRTSSIETKLGIICILTNM